MVYLDDRIVTINPFGPLRPQRLKLGVIGPFLFPNIYHIPLLRSCNRTPQHVFTSTFSALHLKNLSGDGKAKSETCLPNGVTQAGSWSNWLPAQLLFHQAAAQTLPPTCTAVYSKRARTVVSTVQQSQEHTQAPSCEHATCCLRSSFHICKSSPKYT